MKRYFLLLCLLAGSAHAAWQPVVQGADSQTVGPICVPELAGEQVFALDFDTTSLSVTITASNGTDFTYTGGDIDDGPADFSWGDPTTDAIEIDAIAATGCVIVSLRDEVLDESAVKWSITFTDGGSAIMDWTYDLIATIDSTGVQTASAAAITAAGLESSGAAAGAVAPLLPLVSLSAGSIDAVTSTTVFQIDATDSPSGVDDEYNNHLARITDGSGSIYEYRWIADYTGSSNEVTLDSAVSFTPEAGVDTITILAERRDSNVKKVNDVALIGDGDSTPIGAP